LEGTESWVSEYIMNLTRFGDLAIDSLFYDPNWQDKESPLFTKVKIKEREAFGGIKEWNAEAVDEESVFVYFFEDDVIIVPLGMVGI
jgi:hypothetical protein